jgi:hypothetical protein
MFTVSMVKARWVVMTIIGVIVSATIFLAVRAWFETPPAAIHQLPCPACGRQPPRWWEVLGMESRILPDHTARVRCGRVLRQVDGAMLDWALRKRLPTNATPTWPDLLPYWTSNGVAQSIRVRVLQPGMHPGGIYGDTLVISNGVVICKHGGGPLVLGTVDSGVSCPLGAICPEHR